jgi:hypothetical protein
VILTVGLLVLSVALTVIPGAVRVAIARLVQILPPLWARESDQRE